MTILTATAQPNTGSVLLDIAGAPDGTDVLRDAGTGPVPVRNGLDLAAGDYALVDYECPIGVPVVYSADDDEATVILPAASTPGAWLSHPTRPGLNVIRTIESDSPTSWESPGTVHVPIDSGEVTVTYTARRLITGELTLVMPRADVVQCAVLFADGSPVLVRTPPGCDPSDKWIWADVIDVQHEPGRQSRIRIPYTIVNAPSAVTVSPPAPWDWSQVPVEYATWNDVIAAHPSWFDLLGGPGSASQRLQW